MMSLLSSLYGFAITLEVIALMLFGLFLHNSVKRVRKHPLTGLRLRQRKFIRDGFSFFSSVIICLVGIIFFNIALFIQSYRTYAVGEPIAMITVTQTTPGNSFKVQIDELGKPLSDKQNAISREFVIQGDRWILEGYIVRFESFLGFFGFKPIYQLSRIQGSYYSIEDERTKDRTIYSLIDKSSEEWWRWMHEHGDSILFVEMVNGSAASQSLKKGSRYQITVLPTGFSMSPVENPQP